MLAPVEREQTEEAHVGVVCIPARPAHGSRYRFQDDSRLQQLLFFSFPGREFKGRRVVSFRQIERAFWDLVEREKCARLDELKAENPQEAHWRPTDAEFKQLHKLATRLVLAKFSSREHWRVGQTHVKCILYSHLRFISGLRSIDVADWQR
jgi:hypothetical protein